MNLPLRATLRPPAPSSPRHSHSRRGALLLLVLSVLTLFIMIGTLMLVLATRSRASARAFAAAANSDSGGTLLARATLDEALMILLRGSSNEATLPPVMHGQSLLEDRYGQGAKAELTAGSLRPLSLGTLTNFMPILSGTLTNIDPAITHPCDLNGRIITFHPDPGDGDVASFRIERATGAAAPYTVFLSNLPHQRSPMLPKQRCDVVINGAEFVDEAHDAFDVDPWLARIQLENSRVKEVVRPSFGRAGDLANAGNETCDNDGDGVPDGIWLTGVVPDRPAPGGGTLTFKVSYHVVDLDSRVNVNAHGNLAPTTDPSVWSGLPSGRAGLGYGPADIDASRLFADSSGDPPDGMPGFPSVRWSNLAVGSSAPPTEPDATKDQRRPAPRLGTRLQGRYGVDGVAGPANAGLPTLARMALVGNAPTDLHARNRLTVENGDGVPLRVYNVPNPNADDLLETPYALRLDRDGPRVAVNRQPTAGPPNPRAAADNPFTLAELERVLRQFDADASSLPGRLASLLDDYAERSRMTITTDSWDTPAMAGEARRRVRDDMRRFPPPTSPSAAVAGDASVYQAHSPDVSAGLRFDLNRPLDLPSLNPDPGDPANATYRQRKQLLAETYCRHLFTLLVALGRPADKETAQWVANVCDFRDPDSTMTRFRFDTNPLDGWTVDDTNVVYGAERPEIVITETIAWPGHLSVALYHPWRAEIRDPTNDPNAATPTEQIDPTLRDPRQPDTNQLLLSRKTPGDDSVWQIRVDGGATIPLGPTDPLRLTAGGYLCLETASNTGTSLPSVALSSLVPSGPGAGKLILERLANPTVDHDPVTNPYVAIDTAILAVAQDKAAARTQRRSNVAFWKQLWQQGGLAPAPYDDPAPWFHWPNRPFVSAAELCLVPAKDANGMLEQFEPQSFTAPAALYPASDPTSQILDATYVPTRFVGNNVELGLQSDRSNPLLIMTATNEGVCTTAIPRRREPGRVNVNTIPPNPGNANSRLDDGVWRALAGESAPANPFASGSAGDAADSFAKLLSLDRASDKSLFSDAPAAPLNRDPFLVRATAIRLANAATIRSHVFAIWITVKIEDNSARGTPESYHRLFAIVDRSVPVGFSKGQNLNVHDMVRIVRHLE